MQKTELRCSKHREQHLGKGKAWMQGELCAFEAVHRGCVQWILLGKRQGDMRVRPAGPACCAQAVWLLVAFCRSVLETGPLCREVEVARLEVGTSRDQCGGPSKKCWGLGVGISAAEVGGGHLALLD